MYNDPYRPSGEFSADGFRADHNVPGEMTPKKKKFWPKAVALILACVILGGAAGVVGAVATVYVAGDDISGGQTEIFESDRRPNVVEVVHTNTGRELSMEEVYASWVNSTVGISTEIVTTNFFGQTVSAAAGSGFVVSSDGYIVTNYHVIEGARTIKVTFYDGTVYDAVLVGGEENNDVAVLKINAKDLTPVIIGNSDNLHVGQAVTAIGNPLGELTFSQTVGIVSAKDRTITLSGGLKINMIQTDCTINSGNSGGPLFNSYGEVVGITSAKYSNNGASSEATIEGIGFAIPMNDVIDMIKDLIAHGYVTGKPSVGILLQDVDTNAQRYGIPAGAEVLAMVEGSCAERSGLQVGDIITAVGDTAVSGSADLQNEVGSYKASERVIFTVYRGGDTLSLELTLDEYTQRRSEEMSALQEEYSRQQQQQQTPSSGNGGSSPGWGYFYDWPFGW